MKIITSLLFCLLAAKFSASVVIPTQHGPVEGTVKTSDLGRNYFHFMGIPYAKPPLGELKFRVSV